ncbi:CCA tRNA nucleotidyltransferase [Propionibacteriaceae bacterium Y2011]
MPSLNNAQSNALAEMLRITPVVDRLATLFVDAGHELHLVGGSVRDALLGRLGNDLDFTTDARPEQIQPLLTSFARSSAPGGGVWDIGRAFGTIGCRFVDGDGADWVIEVTTYRSDAYAPDSRKPEVAFGDTLLGDLVRRDFTVNAMAIALPDQKFTDPYGGLSDLAAGRLATPGTPEQSFSDDPLRMMRAARFTSQLGFTPDEQVVAAMTAMADRISIISAERVRDELCKLVLTDSPRAGLGVLVDTGLADHVLPELPAMRLERDEHHRHKDVYEHSLTVLEQSIELERDRGHEPDLIGRLAALLHDIGKPKTRRFEPGGKVSFHHHDVVGAKLARKRLQALKFPGDEVKAISKLIELHLRFHGYGGPDGTRADARGGPEWTDSAVRRYVRDAGDEVERLHILTRADCTTRNQRKATRLRKAYDDLERRIAELAAEEELAAIRPDLDGTQIMELLDIGPGPVVGEAYRHLLELRLDRGPMTTDEATAELRQWWADR